MDATSPRSCSISLYSGVSMETKDFESIWIHLNRFRYPIGKKLRANFLLYVVFKWRWVKIVSLEPFVLCHLKTDYCCFLICLYNNIYLFFCVYTLFILVFLSTSLSIDVWINVITINGYANNISQLVWSRLLLSLSNFMISSSHPSF